MEAPEERRGQRSPPLQPLASFDRAPNGFNVDVGTDRKLLMLE